MAVGRFVGTQCPVVVIFGGTTTNGVVVGSVSIVATPSTFVLLVPQ